MTLAQRECSNSRIYEIEEVHDVVVLEYLNVTYEEGDLKEAKESEF